MIQKFPNEAALRAAGYPARETRIAQISDTGRVEVDGVNVAIALPSCGDAVYHDGSRYLFYKGGDALNHSLLAAKGLTDVGQVIAIKDGKAVVLDKTISSTMKYADVVQFAITAINATTIKFYLKMAGAYATFVPIEVELTTAEISAESAAEIDAALNTAGNEGNVGYDKHKYWAYYDAAGSRIVVQCDSWMDYRQYQCSDDTHALVGCTMTHVTWEDMPAIDGCIRRNGSYGGWGLANLYRGYTCYKINGRTPTSNVDIYNTDLVNVAAFNTSEYCANLRAYYGSYMEYLRANMVLYPQEYGPFRECLYDPKALTLKYGNKTAPTKGGDTKYKFPALHYALTVGYGVEGIALGDWFCEGVNEGALFMEDSIMAKINATRAKMGHSLISNSSHRWFAQRSSVYSAWVFGGNNGSLSNNGVYNASLVQAVALLDLNINA